MSPPDSQVLSVSFQTLPTEIRLVIYSQLFYSTRLSFGNRLVSSGADLRLLRVRPALNSLALLRVCSQVNSEIGDSWLGQVLFNFGDLKTMLNKLTDLDPQTLAKVRHMQYSEERLDQGLLVGSSNPLLHRVSLAHALKMLPGLRLDRLTILGHRTAQIGYIDVEQLINHSNGWKELHYVSDKSIMLGFRNYVYPFFGCWSMNFIKADPGSVRKPQPSTWRQALAGRDGPTATVNIYRSSRATEYGTLFHKSATWQALDDQVAEPGKRYGTEWDAALVGPGEKDKALLVVATRGQGADYAERQGSSLMPGDIRERWPGMTWGQLRPIEYYGAGYPTVDTYDRVEDHEWSASHRTFGYPNIKYH